MEKRSVEDISGGKRKIYCIRRKEEDILRGKRKIYQEERGRYIRRREERYFSDTRKPCISSIS